MSVPRWIREFKCCRRKQQSLCIFYALQLCRERDKAGTGAKYLAEVVLVLEPAVAGAAIVMIVLLVFDELLVGSELLVAPTTVEPRLALHLR